jgi:hypothetical protein
MLVVYRLDKRSDDPAFEGFAFVDKTSLLGKRNIYSDFRNFDPNDKAWQPPLLKPLWKAREVVGNVRPENDYPTVAEVPAFSRRAVDALRDLLEPNGEILPLKTAPGVGEYFAYHVTTIADVLDNERSVVRRFEGKYVAIEISHHEFMAHKLVHLSIFRIPEKPTAVFVTDIFADRVRAHSLNGFNLIKVWPLASGTNWYQEAKSELKRRGKITDIAGTVNVNQQPKQKVFCRGLATEERQSLAGAIGKYATLLNIDVSQTSPDAIQSWIDETLRKLQADASDVEQKHEKAFWLAIAWGEAIVKRLGWEWVMLERSDGHQALSVADANHLFVVPVIEYFKRQTKPEADPTSELLYNMIKSNSFSHGSLGEPKILG